MTLMTFVAGAVSGSQRNEPLVESIAAPAGAPAARLNEINCGGCSASTALAVNASELPSVTIRFGIDASTGAEFGITFAARGVGAVMLNRYAAPSGNRPSLTSLVCAPNVTASIAV